LPPLAPVFTEQGPALVIAPAPPDLQVPRIALTPKTQTPDKPDRGAIVGLDNALQAVALGIGVRRLSPEVEHATDVNCNVNAA
jgi:hypothetical protein